MISAKIVEDSIGPNNVRLTTFVLTYPRFIHSELMTHRMISRNASSSRAIPVKKQIQMVIDNPAIPLAFTRNKPGMQGGEALNGESHALALHCWLTARDNAVLQAQALADLEVHKQYSNRILENWAHITVVATATDWNNFFSLRCHYMAQPEIKALAEAMYEERQRSVPTTKSAGEWHLPFVSQEERSQCTVEDTLKMSVARCARVSYLNHEGGVPSLEDDVKLYERLVGSAPIHASPAEHQALALIDLHGLPTEYHGNLLGWLQYRKTLKNENVTEFQGPVNE